MILYADGATPWMQEMAKDIMLLLDTVYPGNPWAVRVYGDDTGGGFHIRHLEFEGKPYGINEKAAHRFATASEMRARVLQMGGELLERVNLRRGLRREGDEVKRMDGVPEKHQPWAYQENKPTVQFDAVVSESELRTTPRPQALKGGS
jgi:hypothetical protein